MESTSFFVPRECSIYLLLLLLTFYATRHCSRGQSVSRIALLKEDLYLVHGAKSVAQVFRTSSLSVTLAYGIALKYCFGMAQEAANIYFADTSGSQHRPIVGSNVPSHNRVGYLTHESLLKGLLGTGLGPASDRFEGALTESFESLNINKEWVDFPDLLEFFEDHVGAAIIRAMFGSVLLSQNPEFVSDLWAYDKLVMSLAKRLPAFCIPRAYKLRKRLLLCIREWHNFATTHSDKARKIGEDDGHPFWGCVMIRDRYKMLLGVEKQDCDSVASTDLGFIWA